MMGRQTVDQRQLFSLFNLEGRIPARHLLRRINPTVTRILASLRERLEAFYSEIGRPSIDPAQSGLQVGNLGATAHEAGALQDILSAALWRDGGALEGERKLVDA